MCISVTCDSGNSPQRCILRSPSCSRQASDAVSAYTQGEMKYAPKLLHLSVQDYPKIGVRIPEARRPQHLDSIDHPVVPLERNHYGHWTLMEEKN